MIYSLIANQHKGPFVLPKLPYEKDSFLPHLSIEYFEYHYEKHHRQYIVNLNNLTFHNELANLTLENIILASYKNPGLTKIFNNAAQVWNHTFFWHSISPTGGGGLPSSNLLSKIEEDFHNFDNFIIEFQHCAQNQFGSGWIWLVFDKEKLKIIKTDNADTPITQKYHPIIVCDLWEHAYYIDFRNRKEEYITIFLNHLINWNFAEKNYSKMIEK